MKKKGGKMRMCIAYQALNMKTIKNWYPIPHNDDLKDEPHRAKLFSKTDLYSGYHLLE